MSEISNRTLMIAPAKKSPLAIWQLITFLLIGLIIGYVIGRFELTTINFRTSSDNGSTNTDQTNKTKDTSDTAKTKEPEKPVNVSIEGDNFLGNKDAKIVLIDFSDYQCPVSKYFTTSMLPKLKADYIDTGKMKYVFKDYPLNMHKFAVHASLTAACAGAQGKYWEMHDMIFNSQEEWSKLETPDETFKGYAKTLALNTAKFDECYASQTTRDEIMEDKKDGSDIGISGTPSLIVNGYITRGVPQDYEDFKAYIDSKTGQ